VQNVGKCEESLPHVAMLSRCMASLVLVVCSRLIVAAKCPEQKGRPCRAGRTRRTCTDRAAASELPGPLCFPPAIATADMAPERTASKAKPRDPKHQRPARKARPVPSVQERLQKAWRSIKDQVQDGYPEHALKSVNKRELCYR
jgi:hypothetical protein